MYYEEKLVAGKMCYRTKSGGTWHPFSIRELSLLYVQLQADHSLLKATSAQQERQLIELEGR